MDSPESATIVLAPCTVCGGKLNLGETHRTNGTWLMHERCYDPSIHGRDPYAPGKIENGLMEDDGSDEDG